MFVKINKNRIINLKNVISFETALNTQKITSCYLVDCSHPIPVESEYEENLHSAIRRYNFYYER